MTAVSVLAGWMLAGRALAPLRAITATARRVSAQNLGERIDLQGPADELKELADTFDRMLARLDQTFAAQRQFVANASHELRTPLAIMRTEIDVALADPAAGAEELRQTAEAVRDAIDRSEGLIAALLTLARSGVITASERAVALEQLCADCVTDLGHRARERRIAVETDLRRATVQGDPDLLERLVGNLLENAVKHNRPGGRLLIATRTEIHDGASFAVLRVENGGAVITPEQAAGLTEPFRRLTRAGPGFGLGLSIVRSVAEAHGGRVELRARPQGGLEVLVTLSALEEEPLDRGTLDAVASRRRSLEDAAGFTGR
jgi:signal transduction histidine kinase